MQGRRRIRRVAALAAILLGGVSAGPATAAGKAEGHAHEHGAVAIGIAIEPGRISVQIESPLDNLLGFERAPRNDAERRKVDAMVARLKAADALFRIDPAAGCALGSVELASAPLGLGKPEPGAKDDGHGDLDADIAFRCTDAPRAAFIETTLFAAFSGMQRLDVQIVAPKGQAKRTLKRPAARIELPR